MAEQFDPSRKFVRVTSRRADGFVEFDFAVGEPEVFAEMMLPEHAFIEFCEAQWAQVLDPQEETEAWMWRLREASRQGYRADNNTSDSSE